MIVASINGRNGASNGNAVIDGNQHLAERPVDGANTVECQGLMMRI